MHAWLTPDVPREPPLLPPKHLIRAVVKRWTTNREKERMSTLFLSMARVKSRVKQPRCFTLFYSIGSLITKTELNSSLRLKNTSASSKQAETTENISSTKLLITYNADSHQGAIEICVWCTTWRVLLWFSLMNLRRSSLSVKFLLSDTMNTEWDYRPKGSSRSSVQKP